MATKEDPDNISRNELDWTKVAIVAKLNTYEANLEKLFEYIENVDTRLKALEEEYLRYDFGYDPIETIRRRLEKPIEKTLDDRIEEHRGGGDKLWKDKFAMDKPDKNIPEWPSNKASTWKDVYNQQVAKDNNLWNPKT